VHARGEVFDRQLQIMQPELGSLFAAGIYERDLTVENIDMVHVEGRDLVQEIVQIDDLVRLRWPLLLSSRGRLGEARRERFGSWVAPA
jgi:hypothetical protein